MKFIVTKEYPSSNEYTVTVAPESKRRIVKNLYWTAVGAGAVYVFGPSAYNQVCEFLKKQPTEE